MPKMLLLMLNFAMISAIGQSTYPSSTTDANCVYKARYTATQRSGFYPFNKTAIVQLVSFRHHYENYPVKPGKVERDSLLETKTLTKLEVNKLTDLLYNKVHKKTGSGSVIQCFHPRNAILFFSSSGSLIEHILLCFHCYRLKESSLKFKLGTSCTLEVEKLRKLFIASGIQFGTDMKVYNYPGETFNEDIVAPSLKH